MKPVFIVNGFLESGKTEFICYTLAQPYFQTKGKTLLIVCEEGEEEYDDDLDDEMVHIDNDEEEETRILSYAEREELERAKRQKEEEDSSDVSNKIDEEIQKSIKSTSESSGYSTIYKDISVGHNFGHIVWAMGGGTVTACTNVSYSWVEYTEGDSVYRDYAWESYGTTIIYSYLQAVGIINSHQENCFLSQNKTSH